MRQRIAEGLTIYEFERLAAEPDVVHGVFTRKGGVSVPPWASLNLSRSTGDSAEATGENIRRILSALGLEHNQTVSAWLNHGERIAVVDRQHMGSALRDTDALVSATPGLVLSMRFADCLPVLLYDAARRVSAIAHAGWPGVLANIAGKTVLAMQEAFGCRPGELWAGIGPAIRVECYEFGPDLAERVSRACPEPDSPVVVPSAGGKVHLDLIAGVKAQLRAAGVRDIEDSGICTACHTDEWFSHRVEKKTGRFGVVLGLR